MPPVSLMIKPASSNCNLRCKYCFYHDLASCREMPSHGMMTLTTLEDILKKAFEFADGSMVMISFQGGEPLLSGKDFFRGFAAMLPRLNTKRSAVHVGVQTNGTLIDEEWCDIFLKNRYLVGLSLDGDAVTNVLRIDAKGEDTFDRVYSAAKMLQAKKVDFNILTVITKPVVDNISRVYSFFRKNKFKHLQFIPCLKPLGMPKADTPESFYENGDEAENMMNAEDFHINADDYEIFLKKAFSLYTRDYIDGRYTSIRLFDNFVRLAHSQRAEQCGMNGHCTHQYVIEADGEVYPCDFYCTDEYSLGNILDTDFAKLERSPKAIKFIEESLGIEEKCKECNYYRLCKNGCKRERIDLDKCTAYKNFFPYALPHLKRMH
ncbi:MAG: SPASM domain-containing protein [Clostridia bacterium]|nr:SPASM domain-containing protein [Clostridia bacterium]